MINEIFETLASDSGRNFKIDYLSKHKDNATLRQAIVLALNPHIQFFIRKIPAYQPAADNGKRITLKEALGHLSVLSAREKTGNEAIAHLQNLLMSVNASDAKVIERIIEKDLKCGVSESTVNKVWPDLIPEYPCMLASAFEQKLVDKVKWPALVQVKMDGMRFNAIVEDGKCEFRSRNGKLIDIPSDLFAIPFLRMASFWGCDMVFDGELLCMDNFGKVLDRKTGNGILNKAVKGTMSQAEAEMVRATLWDAIPLDSFVEGKFDEPYHIRLAKLFNAIDEFKNNTPLGHLLEKVWSKQVDSQYDAQRLFEKFLGEGQEGIILKTREGIWEDKRAKHQIKFKGEYECDLICTAWEEGTGKNVGRLGALQLESACGKLKVGVGSGFNDNDRDTIKPDVVGKIITVKYNAIVDDKTKDTKSLFLPIFLEVREDKDTADTLDKLKG
jgi:ATP-dependent DNA ligase